MGNTVTLYSLDRAIKDGDVVAVRNLLSRKIDVNVEEGESRNTPLHVAAEKGDEMILKLLLYAGAKINAKNSYGFTPLHIAIAQNSDNIEMIKMLVNAGADVNARDNRGNNVLQSDTRCNINAVKCMLYAGIDVNNKNENGETALHSFVQKNEDIIVEYILRHGADVNVKDKHGKTALHVAAEASKNNSHLQTVKVLLKHGARVHEQNDQDEMPFQSLHRDEDNVASNMKIYKLFLDHMVKSADDQEDEMLSEIGEKDPERQSELPKVERNGDREKMRDVDLKDGKISGILKEFGGKKLNFREYSKLAIMHLLLYFIVINLFSFIYNWFSVYTSSESTTDQPTPV